MRRLLLVMALIASACSPGSETSTTTTAAHAATTTTTTAVTTSTSYIPTPNTPATNGVEECFVEGRPFEQEGFMGRDDAVGDATAISGLSWTDSGDCAAITISFRTAEGAPAVDPPAYRGEFLRDFGVVRISFGPDMDDSVVSNMTMESALLDAAYVVWNPEIGGLAVDVHLGRASLARIRTVSAPARLVIEVIRGGPEIPTLPEDGASTVLLSPTPETTSLPFVIEGYGPAGSELVLRVRSTGPTQDRQLTLEGSPTAWTRFSWTVNSVPSGMAEIEAGDAPRMILNLR